MNSFVRLSCARASAIPQGRRSRARKTQPSSGSLQTRSLPGSGFGVLAFWVRCRHQFWYGLCEIVVALIVVILTFFPQTGSLLLIEGPSLLGWFVSKGVGANAGVYIMVRGLDNMDKDLPVTWRGTWDRIFRGARTTNKK
jgi:hypothetical protein